MLATLEDVSATQSQVNDLKKDLTARAAPNGSLSLLLRTELPPEIRPLTSSRRRLVETVWQTGVDAKVDSSSTTIPGTSYRRCACCRVSRVNSRRHRRQPIGAFSHMPVKAFKQDLATAQGMVKDLRQALLPQEYLKANFRRSCNLFVREDLSATQGHITSLQKAAGFCQSSRVLSLLSLLTSISDYFGTFAATGRLRSLSVCLRVSSAWLDYHRRKEAVPRMACPPCRRPCP